MVRSRNEAQRVRQSSEHRPGAAVDAASGHQESAATAEALVRFERTLSQFAHQQAALGSEVQEVSQQVARLETRVVQVQ